MHRFVAVAGIFLLTLFASVAYAECGGTTQCIGIGTSSADAHANHHLPAPAVVPVSYGNQVMATSTVRTLFVAAVTGPAATQAILGTLLITGTDASQFAVTGGSCLTMGPIHGGADCTIDITFTPTSVGAKSAVIHVPLNPPCGGCITERTADLSGTGTLAPPTAGATSFSVQANTPTALNLTPFVSGAGLTGIQISTAPAQGTATISGNTVTYSPTAGYLGADSFSYQVLSGATASAPAVVTLAVVARATPAAEPHVVSLMTSQAVTAQKFGTAQISNISGRLESLHRSSSNTTQPRFLGLSPKWQQARSLPARAAAMTKRGLSSVNPGPNPAEPFQRTAVPNQADRQDPVATGLKYDPATGDAAAPAPGLLTSVATKLASSLATTGSVPILYQNNSTGIDGAPTGGFWTSGTVAFGKQEASSSSSGLRFATSGVTAGYDARLRSDLIVGAGLGYARASTTLGTDGSGSKNQGQSATVYASYQPSPDFFIDGLIGYGRLDSQSERFVATAGSFARSDRSGDQIFGSVSAGYQYQNADILFSPYGRFEFSYTTLNKATESGAGLSSLTYFEQKLKSTRVALGLRAESAHESDFGLVVPHVRIEYGHELSRDGSASVAYADMESGPVFTVTPAGTRRGSLSIGTGLEYLTTNGLVLGFAWNTTQRGSEQTDHTLRFWVATNLDGKPVLSGRVVNLFGFPVTVEAGFRWDDNVSRTGGINNKLGDGTYVLAAGTGRSFATSEHTRLKLSGTLDAEKFERNTSLDSVSAGIGAELNYRADGSFGSPTWGAFARVNWDETESQMRKGHRTTTGLNVRVAVSDRIDLFGILSRNIRNASSPLFDTKYTALKINADYQLHARGTLYASGEGRRGDAVSSGLPMADNAAIADVFVADDAFTRNGFTGYRYAASTRIWTLGYNFQLGNRDSLDVSWRQAVVSPTRSPNYTGLVGYPGLGTPGTAGDSTYAARQFTMSYLTRF